MSNIGDNELQTSPAFVARVQEAPHTDNCANKKYQWAELKSSILVKVLTHDKNVQKELVKWLRSLIATLFSFLRVDAGVQFNKFMPVLGAHREGYPVGQIRAWIGDEKGAQSNFYALFNFIKWVWVAIRTGKYRKDLPDGKACLQKNPLLAYLVVDVFQQQTLRFHYILRGDRLDKPGGEPNDQIGITDLIVPFLKREVRGKPDYPTQAWPHPGQTRCHIPYRGKYGTYIREYTKHDDFYASLQCGISGSVQFGIFMYLLSLFGLKKVPAKPLANMRNLITTLCLIFTGDGGHNVREVVFGFVCTIISMHTILESLQEEVGELESGGSWDGPLTRRLNDYIVNKLQTLPWCMDIAPLSVNEFFRRLVTLALTQWRPFISAAYTYTLGINIVGVYIPDLNAFNPEIVKHPARSYEIAKKWFFNQFFSTGPIPMDQTNLNMVQVFFALDGGRYRLDPKTSFKRVANDLMKTMVKEFPESNIFGKVNTEMAKALGDCMSDLDPENVPLASPRAACTTCSGDAELVVDDEYGYCVDCAVSAL